jgi:hypothetical protein
MTRIAIARTGKTRNVASYLPLNYRVLGRTLDNNGTIIIGDDDHGWGLDTYVIPRLGSGLIACEEIFHREGYEWGSTSTPMPGEDVMAEPPLRFEVIADGSGKWSGNQVTYDSLEEAVAAAKDLMGRWTLVTDWRVVDANDHVIEEMSKA